MISPTSPPHLILSSRVQPFPASRRGRLREQVSDFAPSKMNHRSSTINTCMTSARGGSWSSVGLTNVITCSAVLSRLTTFELELLHAPNGPITMSRSTVSIGSMSNDQFLMATRSTSAPPGFPKPDRWTCKDEENPAWYHAWEGILSVTTENCR